MSKLDNSQISVRDAQENDLPFIFNSWLKSFRNGTFARFVDNSIYFSEHHKLIERIIKRATVKIACSPNSDNDIYGYIVYERIDGIFVLHYAYVKHTFRNLGIFNTLMKQTDHDGEQSAGLFTHSNMHAPIIMGKRNLFYHPYILINYVNEKKESAE